MSGTSLDGVDAVLVSFHTSQPRLLASAHKIFDDELKRGLLQLNGSGYNELEISSLLANELARHYAAAVKELLEMSGQPAKNIAAIGCHGQTVRHRPDLGFTVQLNNPSLLAELTGTPVVADFRSRDMAAGGQGAPLVPAFHQAVFGDSKMHRVIVNIGGISNLTDLPPTGEVSGFDCGPGNVLMDAWIKQHHGVDFDRNGDWALGGELLPDLLHAMLHDKYFLQAPPKSTGRDLFNMAWLQKFLRPHMQPRDVQTTLLALTAQTIADAVNQYSRPKNKGLMEIYLCGGGARNVTLAKALAAALAPAKVGNTDALGVHAEQVEAMAFAWLAKQALHMQPGNVPMVTGARGQRVLGGIYPA